MSPPSPPGFTPMGPGQEVVQHAPSESAWSFWCCVRQTCKIKQFFAMWSLKVSWSSKITPRFLTKLDVVIVACFQVLCFSESIPLCKENMFPNIRMVNILIDITYISILEIIQNNILCKYIIMYWIIHKELPLSYIEKYVTIYLLIYHNICNFIFTSTL